MPRIPKTLAEKNYFKRSLKDSTVFKYMRLFYRNLLKPGRAKPFTLRRMTLYTCQYVFPPTRGYPNGRPCIDDVYGLPDPECPACAGNGHPKKTEKYREIRIMGLFAPFGSEELQLVMPGQITTVLEKIIVGLPIPPEYTAKYGLKPKTDVLDKNGNVIERDVFIGFKLENDDVVIRTEDVWDGQVLRQQETKFVITGITQNDSAVSYFRMFHTYVGQRHNIGNLTTPMPKPTL